jgi:predicted porin
LFRHALAGAALAIGASAHAQSTVTIYGIADTGIERLTNVNAQGHSLVRMPNLTGLVPSRLGFRGNEDLGGGLNAFFNLEMVSPSTPEASTTAAARSAAPLTSDWRAASGA